MLRRNWASHSIPTIYGIHSLLLYEYGQWQESHVATCGQLVSFIVTYLRPVVMWAYTIYSIMKTYLNIPRYKPPMLPKLINTLFYTGMCQQDEANMHTHTHIHTQTHTENVLKNNTIGVHTSLSLLRKYRSELVFTMHEYTVICTYLHWRHIRTVLYQHK